MLGIPYEGPLPGAEAVWASPASVSVLRPPPRWRRRAPCAMRRTGRTRSHSARTARRRRRGAQWEEEERIAAEKAVAEGAMEAEAAAKAAAEREAAIAAANDALPNEPEAGAEGWWTSL